MTVEYGDLLRISAKMSFGVEADVCNVFHFVLFGDSCSNLQAMEDIAEHLDTAYAPLATVQVNDYDYNEVDGFNVTKDEPLPAVSWPTLTSGSSAADPLPSGVAALVTFRTALSRVQGRKYLGGFSEGSMGVDLRWVPSQVTRMAAWAANFLGDFIGGSSGKLWVPVIARAIGGSIFPTEAVAQAIPAYQRRRKPGVGS